MRSRVEITERAEQADRTTIRCVEAGLVPDGVLVLYPRDPVARGRRVLLFVGAIFASALAARGAPRFDASVVFVVALAFALAGVLITPSVAPEDEDRRRPAIVVTATAILKREGRAFRAWRFADLACAQLSLHAGRMDLVLVGADGARSFIDCGTLESGRRLIDVVMTYLPTTMI